MWLRLLDELGARPRFGTAVFVRLTVLAHQIKEMVGVVATP